MRYRLLLKSLFAALMMVCFIVPATASASSEASYWIPADKEPSWATLDDWTVTDFHVSIGQKIQLKAEGRSQFGYQGDLGFSPLVGPDGTMYDPSNPQQQFPPKYDSASFFPDFPVGSLVGVIANGNSISTPFQVLTDSYTSVSEGVLVLAVNDVPGQYIDNSGSFTVTTNIAASGNLNVSGTVGSTASSYTINLPSDGRLQIDTKLTSIQGSGNLWFELSDAAGNLLAYHNLWDNSTTGQIVREGLGNGTYYLKAYTDNGAIAGYDVTSSFTPVTDNEPEPNDTMDQAQTLSFNSPITGHLSYYSVTIPDSSDWYKVTLPSDGKLNISSNLLSIYGSGNLWLSLYDSNGYYIQGYNLWDANTSGFTEHTHLAKGTYYVQVNFDSYASGRYDISASFEPLVDNEPEPNDTMDQAVSLGFNSAVTGHLAYYSSTQMDYSDWYKVTLPADGKLSISGDRLDNWGSGNLWFTLYDANGYYLTGYNLYDGKLTGQAEHPYLSKGTYYIQVNFDSYASGRYDINAAFEPVADNDEEPNNDMSSAVFLESDASVQAHLGYYTIGQSDYEDWYKVSVAQGESLQIVSSLLNMWGGYGNLVFTVYDSNWGLLKEFSVGDAGSSGQTELSNLAEGTYYIQAHFDGYIAGRYQLNVHYGAADGGLPLAPDQNGDGKVDLYDIVKVAKQQPDRLNEMIQYYTEAVGQFWQRQ